MPRKATGKPNGRPPKVAEVAAALATAAKTGVSLEEAAAKAGTSSRTVRAHQAAKRAKGKTTSKASSARTSSTPPAGSAGSAIALPQGGAVSGRPDLLELVREILEARNPAARAELDEGLRVQAMGEAEAFAAWLARPPEVPALAGDELDALEGALARLLALLDKAGPEAGPRIALAKAIDGVSKSLSVVRTRRKPEDKPDEVTRRLIEVKTRAIERTGILLVEAAIQSGGA